MGKLNLLFMKKGKILQRDGINYLHLRIFSVFGENDHHHTLVMSALQKMLRKEPIALSNCTQKWNFLYIKDAVQQIYRLVNSIYDDEYFVCDVYNIASSDTRILREFVYEMKQITTSESVLHFGEIKPDYVVSLNPDISKTYNRIQYISNYTFDMAIKRIINSFAL